MKTLMNISLFVLLAMIQCACIPQERPDPGTTGGSITITGQTEAPSTKTILSDDGLNTIWSIGDQIGLFSPQARTTEDGDFPVQNAVFTAQTSATSTAFNGEMFWGDASTDHNFFAYYPYDESYAGEETFVPISLTRLQTQSTAGNTAHIGVLDYMIATPITVTPPEAVSLTFKHVFSMIEFQIRGSGNLTQVNLTGPNPLAFESGYIDIRQNPDDNISYNITKNFICTTVIINLEDKTVMLDPTNPISVYMMVLPGTQSDNLRISLKIDGTWTDMLKAPPSGGFVRGKKYIVALNTSEEGWSNNTFTDERDDKIYHYTTIGTQVWMTENLAYLPEVSPAVYSSSTEPHYYVYGYNGTNVTTAKLTSNYQTYGVLYNWPAVMAGSTSSSANPSGVQGICPDGWHLPSEEEWIELRNYIDPFNFGLWLKETGSTHWFNDGFSLEGVNYSGFTALPGGEFSSVSFSAIGNYGYWWSCTINYGLSIFHLWINNSNIAFLTSGENSNRGYSVRCLRD